MAAFPTLRLDGEEGRLLAEGRGAAGLSLLGVPSVQRDGAAVDLGGGNRRLVFVMLALAQGRPVGADSLGEEIWGPAPQVDVAGALQRLVSRLRQSLRPAGLTITATGAGYLLGGDMVVDVALFDELDGRGRALAAEDDHLEAAAAFRAALDLWQGPALSGYAERPFARVEAARLEAARAATSEALAAALLAADRAAEAVTALEPLVEAAPYRESAWGALMLALYRAGRQADALEAYRRYRRLLADDLGLEPGPDLRRLEAAILTHADELGAPERSGYSGPAVAVRRHNLPTATARFLGRAAELADLAALLRDERLVTLWGPGGMGKTRLSLEAAARALPDFPDGVWLVELAPVGRPGEVAGAVMAALGMQGNAPATDATVALYRHLSSRQLLVVLDNCEHVLAEAARVAHELLVHCPDVRVLATSREPLGVPGERVWPTRSLVLPAPGAGMDELAACDAVAVFCDRAGRAHAGFALTPANALAVTEICRRLDGMPLALELAAARVRVLGVQGLAGRLDDRLSVLAGGPRTVDPRHLTLAAAVEWSYDLLPPAERRMLEALSVFPGTFDLAAASAVGTDDAEPAVGFQGLDLLSRLVDKSLVETVEDSCGVRYRMLETIRQYAAKRLDDAGGTAAARRRHLDHFLATPVCDVHTLLMEEEPPLPMAHRDHHNYRAALEWALTVKDGTAAALLNAGMHTYWIWAELPTVTPRDWAAQALSLVGEHAGSVPGTLVMLLLAWYDRDLALADEAIRTAARLGDPLLHAWALVGSGPVVAAHDPAQADRNLRTALELVDPATRGLVPACLHWLLAWIALAAGDAEQGAEQAERALACAPTGPIMRSNLLATLAFAVALRGQAQRADALADEAIALAHQTPLAAVPVMALVRATAAACFAGHWVRAEALLRELLSLLRHLNTGRWVGDALELSGVVLEATGRPGASAVLGSAARHRHTSGEPTGGGLVPLAALVAGSRKNLGLPVSDVPSGIYLDRAEALATAITAFEAPARTQVPAFLNPHR